MAGTLTLASIAPATAFAPLIPSSAVYPNTQSLPAVSAGLSVWDDASTTGGHHSFVAFGRDGMTAFVSGSYSSNTVDHILMNSDAPIHKIPVAGTVTAIAGVSSKGFLYAASRSTINGTQGQTIQAINEATRKVTASLQFPSEDYFTALAVSPDGKYLAAISPGQANSVTVIDALTMKVVKRSAFLPGFKESAVSFTGNGAQIYVAGSKQVSAHKLESFFTVYDSATLTTVRSSAICDLTRQIDFSTDGTKAYVGCADGKVQVFSTSNGSKLAEHNVGFGVKSVRTLNNPNRLALGGDSSNRFAGTLNLTTGKVDAQINLQGSVLAVGKALSDGTFWTLLDAGPDRTLLQRVRVASPTKISGLDRIEGSDRYETAVNVSKSTFATSASTVYVAGGEGFADALAAASAASRAKAPLLLTRNGGLPATVSAELFRLQPTKIVVVGGPASVSEAVVAQLKAVTPNVARMTGADRYVVSRATVANGFASASKVYLATGADFPDGVTAASLAGAEGVPMLLVNGKASTLDAASAALLKKLGVKTATLIGGPSVLSAGIQSSLKAQGIQTTRVSGADRYAVNIAANAATLKNAKRVYYVSGSAFADALSVSAVTRLGTAVLMTRPSCTPFATASAVSNMTGPVWLSHIGGPAIVNWQYQGGWATNTPIVC